MRTTLLIATLSCVGSLLVFGCGDDDDDDDSSDSYSGYNDLDVDGDSDGDSDSDADGDSDTEGAHSVTVAWEIGGAFTCDVSFKVDPDESNVELHFDHIRVTVFHEEGDEEPFRQPVDIACGDGSYTIHKLTEGAYYVQLEALADYDGQVLPYYLGGASVTVPLDDPEVSRRIALKMGTGSVTVGWGFSKGSCQNAWNAVSEVVITLEGKRVVLDPQTADCDTAELAYADLEWDHYALAIEGYNAENELTHRGVWGESPGDPDAGVEPTGGEPLDVRPGAHIPADEAWVILYPIETH